MNGRISKKVLLYLIASIWLINGLYCKVLNQVPRHEMIVSRILTEDFSRPLTLMIGFSEIIMAVWILSRYLPRFCAWTQIMIVVLMNVLEFILVPDLLLWGGFNFGFALLFVAIIYFTEFKLCKLCIAS